MDSNDQIILTVILYIVVALALILITRFILSIPKFLKNQKIQITLLAEIAVQSGVDEKKVDKIVRNEVDVTAYTYEYK